MAKRKRDRLYWKDGGCWADFRDYADVGGKRERLVAPGTKRATQDEDLGRILLARRLEQLDGKRRGRVMHGDRKEGSLADVARLDLMAKGDSNKYGAQHLAALEARLRIVLEHLGGPSDPLARQVELTAVTVERIRGLVAHLRRLSNGRGTTMSEGNVRHYLNALSGVFRRAESEGYSDPGFNPVRALLEKPVGRAAEAKWLQAHEAALLLETARRYQAPADGTPFAHALIGFFLLTGCRETEAYGVELDDVSFDRETVRIHPNRWRGLKTRGSSRVIPLWPQLAGILKEYLRGSHRPTGELLFPSYRSGREAMLTDCRKLLDHLAIRSGLARPVLNDAGEPKKKGGWPVLDAPIRTKMFRHGYCSARLQTLDGDAPVATFTVVRELGHSSPAMVNKVYGHLGTVRHRATFVEFRVEQHQEAKLRSGETVAARVVALSTP